MCYDAKEEATDLAYTLANANLLISVYENTNYGDTNYREQKTNRCQPTIFAAMNLILATM